MTNSRKTKGRKETQKEEKLEEFRILEILNDENKDENKETHKEASKRVLKEKMLKTQNCFVC